jgi:hypothetical protein
MMQIRIPVWECPNCLRKIESGDHALGLYFCRPSCRKAFNRDCGHAPRVIDHLLSVYRRIFYEEKPIQGMAIHSTQIWGDKSIEFLERLPAMEAPENFKMVCLQEAYRRTNEFYEVYFHESPEFWFRKHNTSEEEEIEISNNR